MATGCVKILKKAYEFDHLGKFIPENKRGKDVDLFRGELSLFKFPTSGLQTFTLIIFWVGNSFNSVLVVNIIFNCASHLTNLCRKAGKFVLSNQEISSIM